MGFFTCVNCACHYYDKRFAWEKDITAQCATGNPQSADTHDACQQPSSRVDKARTRCDVARMTGTLANWTGMAIPAAAHYLGTVSATGGLVGASCGAAQLHQGLSMPSGVRDPHLVAKGGVTTCVGGTCMMLGACASAWPSLFYGAAGLGLAGLVTATTVDANMNGLCTACRGSEDDAHPKSLRKFSKTWWKKDSKVVCSSSQEDLTSPRKARAPSSCWLWVGHLADRMCSIS